MVSDTCGKPQPQLPGFPPVSDTFVEKDYGSGNCAGPGKPAPGRTRRKQAPTSVGTSSSDPPCALAMPNDSDSPRPLPLTSFFVVTNGSKMRLAMCGATPGPSSFTSSAAWPADRKV